ncbi:MAG: DUF1854 domain-containing protein [Burkholderiaceae bacterium]|nr:MAG: DUF1854 domain-containing protein [Burkholderiaceae bacterium]TAM07543.1 MAG: DUF1854 domain-containing protein [Pusillimonas sp.]
MSTQNLHLRRDAFGRLLLATPEYGEVPVLPVRSFPISAPAEGLALVGMDGAELVWIEGPDDLAPDVLQLIREELASREFTPEIQHIISVSSYATPSRWHIETDRGTTDLILKGEEDIRRLSASTLLIADHNGVHFLIRHVPALDKASRRLLDHFL